jgi:hypothetical protein
MAAAVGKVDFLVRETGKVLQCDRPRRAPHAAEVRA